MSETERLVDNDEPPRDESERDVYFKTLRLWLQQAQIHQNLSTCFPYYMMSLQGLQNNATNVPLLNNNYQIQGQPLQFEAPPPPRPPAQDQPALPPPRTAEEIIARHGGYEYVIPMLYKRVFAEFIDFVLLFLIKLALTFMAVETFEVIDLDKFDFDKFSKNYNDYQFAWELTSEILALEMFYRIVACILEAIFLSCCAGRAGGATPGKALLGLRVLSASAVIPVENRPYETVLVYPGQKLSFFSALARSVIKNLLISLLFPLCAVVFMFRYNRTGYDVLCGAVVVEENLYPPMRHAP